MAEWGTPIMMLGRVGDCKPCAAMAGLGDAYARALPAGSVAGGFQLGAAPGGMGPEPWASYPGSGGPNRVVADQNGPSPDWFRNTITQPVISPDVPQNRQRVFNGGIYDAEWSPRAGEAIRGYEGLGNLVRPWDGSGASSFTMGVRGIRGVKGLGFCPGWWIPTISAYTVLGAVAAGAHGYARTKNVGWTLAWAAGGFIAPLFTNAIAIVQRLSKTSGG
jgi:hypothetical protein